MYNDRIALSSQEILEKEFKIDARGYRLQEVDKFLDIVIHDYNEYNSMIKELAIKNNELAEENEKLKSEIRNLKSNLDALKYAEKEVTNVDLIRRVSQLEKIILGKENN
ncbi:MAG: DivIVA domain-containing protein [Erysipelotrichaceae bacterium]|nr:DivIVA domain-containing protein [Erysipelotrichaceae bacterium]